ncbi:MAG: cyclic nucleotide-binding domain-containing protein, partial [Actinomycetes bacterium]
MPVVDDLLALPLFAGTGRADLTAVASRFQELPFAAGDVLYRQGDPGTSFLLLTAGRLAVLRADGVEEHELLEAGPGSVLGELAMLTGRHRMATVVARTDGLVLVGDDAVFDALVHLVPVHDRVAEVIARRVAELAAPVPLTLADGTEVEVRPLLRSDRGTLEDLIGRQSDETLRRRFFSPGHPGPRVVDHLVEINYLDHFAWGVTTDHGAVGVATARYVRLRDDPTVAELAFGIADEFQGLGLGTLLLGALAWAAAEAGIKHFTAEVLSDNLP